MTVHGTREVDPAGGEGEDFIHAFEDRIKTEDDYEEVGHRHRYFGMVNEGETKKDHHLHI